MHRTYFYLLQSDRSERSDRDLKRDQMERLVREELERWDSEASMNRGETSPTGSRAPTAKSSRGSLSRASQASAGSRMHVSSSSMFVLRIFLKYFSTIVVLQRIDIFRRLIYIFS